MAEDMSTEQQIDDYDFDVTRTFTVLTATLVLPVYLALSVMAYATGAII